MNLYFSRPGAGAAWEYAGNPDNSPYLLGAMTPDQRRAAYQGLLPSASGGIFLAETV